LPAGSRGFRAGCTLIEIDDRRATRLVFAGQRYRQRGGTNISRDALGAAKYPNPDVSRAMTRRRRAEPQGTKKGRPGGRPSV
jgi:hypothetical protein